MIGCGWIGITVGCGWTGIMDSFDWISNMVGYDLRVSWLVMIGGHHF